MSIGKLAAQAGHAFTDALLEAQKTDPALIDAYQGDGRHGIKICLIAETERHLLRAYDEALRAGLPCAIVVDQHHIHPPHFDGSPIITALGIGPARRADAHAITKRFSLCK